MTRLHLEIPLCGTLEQLQLEINDRLRRIAEQFAAAVSPNISGNLDMGGNRVIGMADPKSGADGLTLGFADQRYYRASQTLPASVIPSAASVGVGPANVYTYSLTLTADQAIASPIPVAENSILYVMLLEDATGGWDITWSADFSSDTPVDIDNGANVKSIFQFVGGADGIWHYIAPFVTVQP